MRTLASRLEMPISQNSLPGIGFGAAMAGSSGLVPGARGESMVGVDGLPRIDVRSRSTASKLARQLATGVAGAPGAAGTVGTGVRARSGARSAGVR